MYECAKNPIEISLSSSFEEVVDKSSEETRDAKIDYLETDVRGVTNATAQGNTS